MHSHTERDHFAPPRPPGRLRAIALAVLAHAVLIAALTWGVNWKTSSDDSANDGGESALQAQLWSALPQQAAAMSLMAWPWDERDRKRAPACAA